VKLTAHRAGLPGNVDMIAGSAFLPAPAHGQEGGASSRLAREDSADRTGRKSPTNVLWQESEREATQEETECFDRSDRILLAESNNSLGNYLD